MEVIEPSYSVDWVVSRAPSMERASISVSHGSITQSSMTSEHVPSCLPLPRGPKTFRWSTLAWECSTVPVRLTCSQCTVSWASTMMSESYPQSAMRWKRSDWLYVTTTSTEIWLVRLYVSVTTDLHMQVLKAVVAQFNASQLITQRGKVITHLDYIFPYYLCSNLFTR